MLGVSDDRRNHGAAVAFAVAFVAAVVAAVVFQE